MPLNQARDLQHQVVLEKKKIITRIKQLVENSIYFKYMVWALLRDYIHIQRLDKKGAREAPPRNF